MSSSIGTECASSAERGPRGPGRAGWGVPARADGKLDAVLITGFPAGMLQCNCYVLAQRPGPDAIIVDPGQRAMGQLRRILDENRLTPAAVLLTHGHVDHIWSAQKVADTYGCPAYIHPEDRFMLTDPIKGFGPAAGQLRSARCSANPSRSSSWTATATRSTSAASRHRRPHARAHPRIGGLPGRRDARAAGQTSARRRRVHRRHAVPAVRRPHRPARRQRARPAGSIVTKLLVLDDDTVVLPGHGENPPSAPNAAPTRSSKA